MAIAFRAASTAAGEPSGGTISVPRPTGTTAGDVLIAHVVVAQDDAGATISSSGWVVEAFFPPSGVYAGVAVLSKVAGGSEPTSYTFSKGTTAANQFVVHIHAWTGVDTTGSLSVAPAKTDAASASSSIVAPSVSVPTSGDELVCAWSALLFNATPNSFGFNQPAGMTERSDLGYNWAHLGVASESRTAGSTGTRTATFVTRPSTATTPNNAPRAVSYVLKAGASGPIAKAGTDTASGTDSAYAIQPQTSADTATGSDSAGIAIPFVGADSATGTDVAFAGIPQPSSDSGTGGETWSSTAAVAGTDARTGVEALSIAADLAGADAPGTGVDAAHIIIPADDSNDDTDESVYIDADLAVANPGVGADGAVVETLFGDLVISLYAIHPTTGATVPLPDFTQLTLSPQRNDAGSISLDYPSTGLNFDLLRSTITSDRDLEVEIWTAGTSQGALRGYLQEAAGDDVAEDSIWKFAGGFLELRMTEAVVWPQPIVGVPDLGVEVKVVEGTITTAKWDQLLALGYTGRAGDDQEALYVPQLVLDAVLAGDPVPVLADDKRELRFSSVTPGEMVGFIMAQARARGALTDVEWDFTATQDSSGTTWPKVISTKFSPGAGYNQILERLVSFDLAEWAIEWTGTARVLRLWVPAGRGGDLTVGARPVVLRRGRNLIDAPRKWSVRESGTALLAVGGEGFYDDVSSADAQTRRGRRIEVTASANNLQDEDALSAFAQAQLPATTTGLLEVTHGIGFLPGEPRPIIAFTVGDWVYSQTGTTMDRLRVVQWTLTVDAQQNPSGTVTLNDTVQDALVRLQGRLNALTAGETVVGTSEPSQQEDTGTPLAPAGVIVGSTAYLVDGVAHAAVTVSWDPVTHNTDGSAATDIGGYKAQYAYDAAPTEWIGVEDVGPNRNSATFDASPGVQLSCRAAAYDQNGNVSEWSDPVGHTTEDDTTPPGVPSAPEVTDWFGTIRIRWDGKTEAGTDMYAAAPDFSHVQVHVSPGSMFTPDATTQVGELRSYGTFSAIDLPYEVTQYVRLVAMDLRGNASAPSGQGSATPVKLVNIDIGPNAVDRVQIIDGEIVNAKIADLAVNNAKIMDVEVGKLRSGYVEADMILSTGEIRSGDDPNNYNVLDTAGLRMVYQGQTRVEFNRQTGDALITGTYRSALSGERINLLPDGTLRIYGTSGTDYGELANEGGVWRARSRADANGRRSQIDFDPTGMKVRYGTATLTGTMTQTRTQLDVGLTYGVINAPVTGIRVWTQYAPADGTQNRFHFVTANSGGDIERSVLHYRLNPFKTGGVMIVWPDGNEGSGVHWDNNAVGMVRGDGNAYVYCDAADFRPLSSELAKRDIGPIRHDGLTSLDIIDRIASLQWRYDYELDVPKRTIPLRRQQPDGSYRMEMVESGGKPSEERMHFFPIAEHLAQMAPSLVHVNSQGSLAVGLRDTVGLLWDALRTLSHQVKELQGVPAVPVVVEGQVLDPKRWAELPATYTDGETSGE